MKRLWKMLLCALGFHAVYVSRAPFHVTCKHCKREMYWGP